LLLADTVEELKLTLSEQTLSTGHLEIFASSVAKKKKKKKKVAKDNIPLNVPNDGPASPSSRVSRMQGSHRNSRFFLLCPNANVLITSFGSRGQS